MTPHRTTAARLTIVLTILSTGSLLACGSDNTEPADEGSVGGTSVGGAKTSSNRGGTSSIGTATTGGSATNRGGANSSQTFGQQGGFATLQGGATGFNRGGNPNFAGAFAVQGGRFNGGGANN